MKIGTYLKRNYGYDSSVNDVWSKYVQEWKSWYAGKVRKFHNYQIYNGHSYIRCERMSLQMAKKCCEDWADLLFNPKCTVSLADEKSTAELLEILNQNDFWRLINESIERSGATGTGAIVTNVSDIVYNEDTNTIDVSEAKTNIEYIDAEQIYPISWVGKKITECAFCANRTLRGKNYCYLTVHRLNDMGNYVIENKVFLNVNGNLTVLKNEGSTFDSFDTKSDIPWFAILSPPEANNIYPSLPWGLAYYANCIDTIKAIDIGFDSFVNEIVLGRKRIFVRGEMTVSDDTGEYKVFDDNDMAVYVMPEGVKSDDLIQPVSDEIRSESIIKYIESMLSAFSANVGFGKDKYSFDTASLSTATQVISQNSDMFRRKRKNELAIESALFDIINCIAYASTEFGHYNINPEGLVIQFDDSVVENTDAIANRAMREQAASLISPVEYRMEVKGETEEVATAKIKKIKEDYPSMNELIGGANA